MRVVLKWKKFLFLNTLALTIAAVIISLILPKSYKATTQILPPAEEMDMLGLPSILSSAALTSRFSSMARAGGLVKGGTPSDLLSAIVQSRTIREAVVVKCDLITEFKMKKNSMEIATKSLEGITKVAVTSEGVVKISVVLNKPELSADVANAYVDELDRFLQNSNMSRGRNMRIFVEKRLAQAEGELREAQDSLQAFQLRNKVVALDEETRAAIAAYAELKSKMLIKEMELGALDEIAAADNPYSVSVRRERDQFARILSSIESGTSDRSGYGVGFAVPFHRLPVVAAEYARRLREYKVREQVYSLLVQQYEQAKITEVRDTPAITVLDPARVPERKSSPRRARIVLGVFMLSIVLGLARCYAVEYLAELKQHQPKLYNEYASLTASIKSEAYHMLKRIPIVRRLIK